MKRLKLSLALIVLLLVTGCEAGMIHVDAIKPNLDIVMDRHDAYVETGKAPNGAELTDVQKRTQLRSTKLLRDVLEAAKAKP